MRNFFQSSDIKAFLTNGNTVPLEGLVLHIDDVDSLTIGECAKLGQFFTEITEYKRKKKEKEERYLETLKKGRDPIIVVKRTRNK